MSKSPFSGGDVAAEIKNIGGIHNRDLEFQPGITVLTGENATNRTSTLKALMAACGGGAPSFLRAGSKKGEVTLSIGDETYTRTFERVDGGVSIGGEPLLTEEDEIMAAEYFAFLLSNNEARNIITADPRDLREFVMDPVDIGDIEQEKRRIRDEIEEVKSEIRELEKLKNQTLPELETERDNKANELELLKQELAEKREELADADQDLEASEEKEEAVQELTETLKQLRLERDSLENKIQSRREALSDKRNRLDELEHEVEKKNLPDENNLDELEDTLKRLRDQQNQIEGEVSTISDIITFNKKRLNRDTSIGEAVADALGTADNGDDESYSSVEGLTEQLTEANSDEHVRCWTCGQEAEKQQIEKTIDALQEVLKNRQQKRRDIEAEIEDVRGQRRELRNAKQSIERLEDEIQEITEDIDRLQTEIQDLEGKKERVQTKISSNEENLNDLRSGSEGYNHVIQLHRSVASIESQIDIEEKELEEREREVTSTIEKIEELEGSEAKLESLERDLERQKQRISEVEDEVIEQFNAAMDDLIEILEYDSNVSRVWIEKQIKSVRDGRNKKETTVFNLQIVRENEHGAAFEDPYGIEHLSESEREVVGLVFALSGYLAHDVHQYCPFLILDSIEAIDSERISELVEYFKEHAEYLVVALLPEDKQPLIDDRGPETVIEFS